MEILSFLKKYRAKSVIQEKTPDTKEKIKFYHGILIKKPVSESNIQDGCPVITLEGDTGIIVKFYGSIWRPGKERWIDVKLDNKSYKHVHSTNIFVLYLRVIGANDIPLSHACYKFVKPDDIKKVFKFRMTNRGYGMFDEDLKVEREYIAVLRRTRYGANFISRLEELGFQINKK